jgi:hypothetical protein
MIFDGNNDNNLTDADNLSNELNARRLKYRISNVAVMAA